jgi:hypothetical protein
LPTIDAANEEVLRRLLAGEPVLTDVVPAAQAIAGPSSAFRLTASKACRVVKSVSKR